jgi:hypothetical protein
MAIPLSSMTIDFTCQKCDSSFELDEEDVIDGSEKLVCPNCDAKAPVALVDDFIAALVEMRAQVAALSKRFSVNMAIETEDLEVKKADDDEEEDVDDDDDFEPDDDGEGDEDDEDLEEEGETEEEL